MNDETKKLIKRCGEISARYRVGDGEDFQLKDCSTDDLGSLKKDDKEKAAKSLEEGKLALAAMQERLYAQDRWSLLLIFQAMDAAGKDGAIKHVMSGVNPQGCQVSSFGVPSSLELDHDWLWRCIPHLPERGRIGIFNRSYYEEVLIARVHPEILQKQKLPPELVTKKIWKERYEDMRNFEQHLARNGTIVRKFFLHVSKEEQQKRLLARLDEPEKNWKFQMGDVKEREYWKDYQKAYDEMIRNTSTKESPWFVVPADHKWYTRIVVGAAIVDALASLDLHFPKVDKKQKDVLAQARTILAGESKGKSS